MEMGKILSADVLDIIFDERNKEYGAYDLRKHYQRRLTKSLMLTLLVVVLICLTYILLGSMKPGAKQQLIGPDIILDPAPPLKEKKMELPPPPKKIEPAQVKMIKDMIPLIVKDNVPIDDPVPEQKDIVDAKIGNVTTNGTDDIGIVGPPVAVEKGIIEAPKKQEDDGRFVPVEVESKYPGGLRAWGLFLNRNLLYPQPAIDNHIEGTVYIQFIVDAQGDISDITAISGPEELRPAAIAVIRKSGKWEPAIQNGRHVKSYKKQPITFRLEGDQ